MGAISVLTTFKSDSHCLDTVLFLPVANHHGFFAQHHVPDALRVVAHALVSVEPFDFLEMCVLLIEIVAPDAESDSDKQQGSCNGIDSFGDCRPYSTVDDAMHPVV